MLCLGRANLDYLLNTKDLLALLEKTQVECLMHFTIYFLPFQGTNIPRAMILLRRIPKY